MAAVAVGLPLGVLANARYGMLSGHDPVWDSPGTLAFDYVVSWVLGMVHGFAYGAVFLNYAAAIVVFFVYSFVLPLPFAIAAQLIDWFDSLRPWIDFNVAQTPCSTDRSWADSGHTWPSRV